MAANSLKQIIDPAEIEKLCLDVIAKNQEAVQKYKGKSEKKKNRIAQSLINEVVHQTEKKANMALVAKIIREFLDK